MWLRKHFKHYTRATEFAERKEQEGCVAIVISTFGGYAVSWKPPLKLWNE